MPLFISTGSVEKARAWLRAHRPVHRTPLIHDLAENCPCRYSQKYRHCCYRHWQDWAKERLNKLVPHILDDGNVYHAVLHFRHFPERDERARMARNLKDSLKYRHGDLLYYWVTHLVEDEIHLHYLLLTTDCIDEDWFMQRWAKLRDKFSSVPYRPRDAYCKRKRSARAVLAYMLGLKEDRPPHGPAPWEGLRGKFHDGNLLPRRRRN